MNSLLEQKIITPHNYKHLNQFQAHNIDKQTINHTKNKTFAHTWCSCCKKGPLPTRVESLKHSLPANTINHLNNILPKPAKNRINASISEWKQQNKKNKKLKNKALSINICLECKTNLKYDTKNYNTNDTIFKDELKDGYKERPQNGEPGDARPCGRRKPSSQGGL